MSNSFSILLKEFLIIFKEKLSKININSELDKFKIEYFSKLGLIAKLTDNFKKISLEEKKEIGGKLQDYKNEFYSLFCKKQLEIFLKFNNFPESSSFDPGLKKETFNLGSLHPYTIELRKINDYFSSIGFEVLSGSIVDTDDFNFTYLNIPEDHPARDEHDTFWLTKNKYLLRTHTSTTQVREAKKRIPPFGFISSGFVYRNEATDASHDFMFMQLEGLYLSQDASLSSLLFVMEEFLKNFFEKDSLKMRVRPGLFPFVEPGIEVDFECPFCKNGCSTCKQTKWIELGGAGMVHPNVLKNMLSKDYINKNQGWAFGFGLTRLIMIKYKIDDIRKLHSEYEI